MTRELSIATRTLIVLCGTAGAGKRSTFAQQHFKSTPVVSSDTCRALICDGDRTDNVDPDIFELFHFLIQKRLKLGRLTVADSTALYDFARRRLLDLACEADYHTCLLVFNVSWSSASNETSNDHDTLGKQKSAPRMRSFKRRFCTFPVSPGNRSTC